MSLWVDKYRPRTLDQLDYHVGISNNLRALSKSGDFPHLLVYGPSGAGKKTRIYAILNEIFGSGVEKLKIDVKTFVTPSNKKLEFNALSSPYHLEVTPSDMGNSDRLVIQDMLKEIALTEQVDFTKNSKNRHRFKVVVINEADSLTRDAQAALRRTMEKYSSNIRLILVSNSISNIIAPIKSRTLLVRVASPSDEEVGEILYQVSQKESLKFSMSDEETVKTWMKEISKHSNGNLRRALLCFETVSMQSETIQLQEKTAFLNLDWELVISDIADSILKTQTVANLAKIRVTFYELLSHCIPDRIILKTLVFKIITMIHDQEAVRQIVGLGSLFDERLSLGSKSIFHLEGFTAKAMMILDEK